MLLSSITSTELTACAKTTRNSSNDSSSLGFEIREACHKCFFSRQKASSYSLFRWNLILSLSTLKNKRQLVVAFERNQLNAANQPVRFCTSLGLLRDLIPDKALTFSKLASMSRQLTMQPKNFQKMTLKAHLRRYPILYFLRI